MVGVPLNESIKKVKPEGGNPEETAKKKLMKKSMQEISNFEKLDLKNKTGRMCGCDTFCCLF